MKGTTILLGKKLLKITNNKLKPSQVPEIYEDPSKTTVSHITEWKNIYLKMFEEQYLRPEDRNQSLHNENKDIIQKINTKPSNVTIIKTTKRLKHIRLKHTGIWPFIKQI